MKAYLFDLFLLSLIFGILLHLSPDRYRRIITSALCLILMTCLLSPLTALVGDLGSLEPPDFDQEQEGGAYIDTARSAFEEGVASYLSSEFSVDAECIEVEAIGFDFSAMTAERLIVTLKGRGTLLDTKKIKNRLEAENLGEVEVKLEF
jgi:hypothetical protein